jgi:hypothetical protein
VLPDDRVIEAAAPLHPRGGIAVGYLRRKSQSKQRPSKRVQEREVGGGYAQFEFKSRDEAIEVAVRFMELHKKHWPGGRARPMFARRLEGLAPQP